jgi:hypothetical protein
MSCYRLFPEGPKDFGILLITDCSGAVNGFSSSVSSRKGKSIPKDSSQEWWLAPVILASWETPIERIDVPGQPRQKVCETPSHWKKAGCDSMCLTSQQWWKA